MEHSRLHFRYSIGLWHYILYGVIGQGVHLVHIYRIQFSSVQSACWLISAASHGDFGFGSVWACNLGGVAWWGCGFGWGVSPWGLCDLKKLSRDLTIAKAFRAALLWWLWWDSQALWMGRPRPDNAEWGKLTLRFIFLFRSLLLGLTVQIVEQPVASLDDDDDDDATSVS